MTHRREAGTYPVPHKKKSKKMEILFWVSLGCVLALFVYGSALPYCTSLWDKTHLSDDALPIASNYLLNMPLPKWKTKGVLEYSMTGKEDSYQECISIDDNGEVVFRNTLPYKKLYLRFRASQRTPDKGVEQVYTVLTRK